MLFWKDVWERDIVRPPAPFQIAPELPTVTALYSFKLILLRKKSGRNSRGNADLDCCDAWRRLFGALHWADAFSFNFSVL